MKGVGWNKTKDKNAWIEYTCSSLESGRILGRIENSYRKNEFLLRLESGFARHLGTFISVVKAQEYFENYIKRGGPL